MRSSIALALALAACSKDGSTTPSSRGGVVEAWKKGGLEPSQLTPMKTELGSDCANGSVNKIDVLVCTFLSASEAKAAEDKGLAWVADRTGAAKALGELPIVVADRRNVDPRGHIINQLITLPAK